MATGTAVGNTVFVMGREQDSNREIRVFQDGDTYDTTTFSVDQIQGYTALDSTFPYLA